MKETDIANFAESILAEEMSTGKPVQFSAPQAPDAPDISEVKVGHDFTAQVLSEGNWDKADIVVEKPSTAPVTSVPKKVAPLREENVYKKHLIKEYKKKVQDLDELVTLMEEAGVIEESMGSTVGVIGTGGVGSSKSDPFKKEGRRNGFTDKLRRRKQKTTI